MDTPRLILPDQDQASPARILILGSPGVGKTRLACSFPSPLVIDVESDGASSASVPPPPRYQIPIGPQTLQHTVNVLTAMGRCPFEDGALIYEGLAVKTVVIDPIDQIQRSVQTYQVLKGRDKMQPQDWGVLLEKMYPMVMAWSALPVTAIVVGHVKKREAQEGAQQKMDEADLAVRGALRTEMPGWFSLVLHVITGTEGKRYVIRDNMVHQGTRYLAKDRHDILGGIAQGKSGAKSKVIEITGDTGYPDGRIAEVVNAWERGRSKTSKAG